MNLTIGLADVVRVAPMLVLFLASLVPISIKVMSGNREQKPISTLLQGLGGIFASAVLLLTVYSSAKGSPDPTAFANAIVVDGLALIVGLIALMSAAGSLMLAYDNPSTNGEQFSELVFLSLNAALGMLILCSAADFLVVFIGLETMSLALYLMIGCSHEQRRSKESALKYFLLGGFASAIFLYGLAFVFGTVGSTYISDVVAATGTLIQTDRLFLLGILLVTLGFLFKVAIVPFHAWTPDVYQGAPTPHTALMATAVKAVSFAALLRLISTKSPLGSEFLLDLLQWLAVITMIVGNVAALIQSNLKRTIAYSSVAHSGYLLVGVVATGVSANMSFTASGVLFYLLGYSAMTLGALAVVSYLEKTEDSEITVESLAGLARRQPLVALCFTVCLLSLAGIPPTIGFFGKLYLFSTAIGEGLVWLAVWGVVNSVISAYFYLRPIVVMYMNEGEGEYVTQPRVSTQTALYVSVAVVLLLGVLSGPLFSAIEKALL